jgi:hypothetical protein
LLSEKKDSLCADTKAERNRTGLRSVNGAAAGAIELVNKEGVAHSSLPFATKTTNIPPLYAP